MAIKTEVYNDIREFFGFRKATVMDAKAISNWLTENVLTVEAELEHLKEIVYQRFRDLKIEPLTPGRIERLIRSAKRTYETEFFAQTLSKLSPSCRTAIDTLLKTTEATSPPENEGDESSQTSLFKYLSASPKGNLGSRSQPLP